MFRIKKTDKDGSKYKVLLEEKLLKGTYAEVLDAKMFGPRNIYVNTDRRDVGELLIPHLEKDSTNIGRLFVKKWDSWDVFDVSLTIYNIETEGLISLTRKRGVKQSFDFSNYYIEFSRLQGESLFAINTNTLSGKIDIDFTLNIPFLDSIRKAEEVVRKYHDFAINTLNRPRQTIDTIFHFPSELKVQCEQYLLYFIQFLQDLGIRATSNLKEEAGNILFSITPTDSRSALERIREALALYLNLPSSPIAYDESFASIRLQQQIENLQHSQKMAEREIRTGERELLLAQKIIEVQDEIGKQKDLVIDSQKKIIEKITSPSIIIDSLKNKEELEEIFDGLKIGESETLKKHTGIHWNPATFLRKIGNTFLGREEKSSIFGSDVNDKNDKK